MKKITSVTLAILLILGVFANYQFVYSADESGTPDDAFDGGYAEFKGSDGSVTCVYDNGSVSTTYADGSKSGVDYNGNQYELTKDGTYSVRTPDGIVATEYPDGTQSMTEPNGKTTTVKPDGSVSESYGIGVTADYDAEGNLVGVGVTGSDERLGVDEDGNVKNGEIKGKNGESLSFTDDGFSLTNSDGTKYGYNDDGIEKNTTIQWTDGSEYSSNTSISYKDGIRTEDTAGSMKFADGTRWDSNKTVDYDTDGNPIYSANDVSQWTSVDGATFWKDNNSGASEYRDINGNKMITDKYGNLTSYNDGKNVVSATYDENGNVVSAYINFEDGASLVRNAEGGASFTAPDGTIYYSDGNGNVTVNGVPVKVGGEFLEEQSGSDDENSGVDYGDEYGDETDSESGNASDGDDDPDSTNPFGGGEIIVTESAPPSELDDPVIIVEYGEDRDELPLWLNGAWSGASYDNNGDFTEFHRESVRYTIINNHTLYEEEYYYPDPEHPDFPSGLDYAFEREYLYYPETQTVLIFQTETGVINGAVYGKLSDNTYLKSRRIERVPEKDHLTGHPAIRTTMEPREMTGKEKDGNTGTLRFNRGNE